MPLNLMSEREMTSPRPSEAAFTSTRRWSQALALSAAASISLALMLDPYILSGVSALRIHEGLPLLMLGVSSAFAYGFGFTPAGAISRMLLHPALAWASLGVGGALMVLR
jgi:predicted membrane protein